MQFATRRFLRQLSQFISTNWCSLNALFSACGRTRFFRKFVSITRVVDASIRLRLMGCRHLLVGRMRRASLVCYSYFRVHPHHPTCSVCALAASYSPFKPVGSSRGSVHMQATVAHQLTADAAATPSSAFRIRLLTAIHARPSAARTLLLLAARSVQIVMRISFCFVFPLKA